MANENLKLFYSSTYKSMSASSWLFTSLVFVFSDHPGRSGVDTSHKITDRKVNV